MLTGKENFGWLILGRIFGSVASFAFFILAPLTISLHEYGVFTWVLTLAYLTAFPLMELGLDMQVTRQVSRGDKGMIFQALLIRLGLSVLAAVIMFALCTLFGVGRRLALVIFIYFFLLNFQNLIFSFYRGLEQMKLEGVCTFLQKMVSLLSLFTLPFLIRSDALLAGLCLLFSMFAGWMIMLLFFGADITKKLRDVHHHYESDTSTRELLKEATMLGCISFLGVLYFRIDTVMIGFYLKDLDVGIYQVSFRILEATVYPAGVLMLVFFPRLSKPKIFTSAFRGLFPLLLGGGILIAIITWFLGPLFIAWVYPPDVIPSAGILRVLSLAIVPIFIGHLLTQSLVATKQSRIYFIGMLASALINILLNAAVIPYYGPEGAAWTTLVTEMFIAFYCLYHIQQHHKFSIWAPSWKKDISDLFASAK